MTSRTSPSTRYTITVRMEAPHKPGWIECSSTDHAEDINEAMKQAAAEAIARTAHRSLVAHRLPKRMNLYHV